MIFKIGTHDFSKCVVMGSYNMTKQDVFHEYTDANGVKHRNIYRTRCSGSLQLYFRTNELLNEFIDALKEKASGGYNVVTATINNTHHLRGCPPERPRARLHRLASRGITPPSGR